eukprot:m.64222 g.64222  ORF g.64222 m.64222 type:complete len:341 (+) comp11992_c1_seq1:233-1255(+)
MSDALPGIKVGTLFFPYRYVALVLLMVQTTTSILVLRYSRSHGGASYISTTAVVMSEVFKLFGSAALLAHEQSQGLPTTIGYIIKEVQTNWKDSLKLGVPAILYTVQNNLLFIALSNLSAATYQVTYQLKILTTALFSVVLLGRSLSWRKWGSLVVLMTGVALVQMPSGEATEAAAKASAQQWVGLIAVLSACCSSGFAGVYFEKILKGTKQSLWLRNVQLSFFSIFLGLFGVVMNDWDAVSTDGFFQNYSTSTWVAISLQAFGGLIIAAVIKYADNILKGFANSISIILTGLLSFLILGDFNFTAWFGIGTVLVTVATFLYGMPDPQKASSSPLPTSQK